MTDGSDALLRAIRGRLSARLNGSNAPATGHFLARFDRYAPDIYQLLYSLYGIQADFARQLEAIFETAADAYSARTPALHRLDHDREANPTWYQHHEMMGAFLYVDQFAGTLAGVHENIPYFRELGLTYLHLMPLFKAPEGPSDGGYAVSSYRQVNEAFGTMEELRALADELNEAGISLVLDFVFNHTSDDHTWAQKARAGDPHYQNYYFFFEDRTLPDAYEHTLREIFPDEHPGAFTYQPDIDRWVWTTFHSYQWDLNYGNPALFRQMLEEMLFLANIGVDVLRMDAVPFIWKKMGTPCENLPQAHTLIRAYNALVRIAAPGMIFKSEAIVHPDDVVKYLGTGEWAGRECEISYNPLLMVELWEALATGYTHLLRLSIERRFSILPGNAAWVNYVRSHDDIGWGFADEDAEALGIHGFGHRQYLNRFYTGEEPGSFAVGYPFQFNPRNLDMRISGTTASLAGLEKALNDDDAWGIELAIRRVLLMYSIALSMGGLPLLHLGDEIGTLNDYTFLHDPARADDSRWHHRAPYDWKRHARRTDPTTIAGRVYEPMLNMIRLRKEQPSFGSASSTRVLATINRRVYGYVKSMPGQGDQVLVLCNFTTEDQRIESIDLGWLETGARYHDLLSTRVITGGEGLILAPYEVLWIGLR